MGRNRQIIFNTLLLTAASFLMRAIGMAFQVYLTRKIGAAGIGLFQLIMSVYILFTTFAISGIRFATTRLVSEELGSRPDGRISGAVRKCLLYALIFGTAATVILLLTAKYIGNYWLKDIRSVLSLKILSLSLPFLSMSSVLSGYFTAVCRVYKTAAAQFTEQLTRIALVYIVYSLFGSSDIELSCAVIMAGSALGDIVSFSLQYVLYLFDRKRYNMPRKSQNITSRMLNIALPLALSAYARTALSTLQQLLVPVGFRKAGSSSEKALADYGIIHGMVLPILTLPSAFFYSLGEIIVPELTAAQVCGDKERISKLSGRIIRVSIIVSLGISVILYKFSNELGYLFFGLEDVGKYIRILSFLMPVMYLDSITDGLLRGLGQQLNSMWINIADSVISVALVYTLLPEWAVNGYLFIICFTEVFNFTLSMKCLIKTTDLKINLFTVFRTVFSAFASAELSVLILRSINITLNASVLSVITHIFVSLIFYLPMLNIFRCIEKSDLKYFLKKRV